LGGLNLGVPSEDFGRICSPNEDFGRMNKRGNPDFTITIEAMLE
jgi:hypothetical protein